MEVISHEQTFKTAKANCHPDGDGQTSPKKLPACYPCKKLLSPKEIEHEFGIHKKMLADWRSEGIGPSYSMFGIRILYERSVIENYIVSKRSHTASLRQGWRIFSVRS